ncbi:ABC transporter ATP-binding protein [Actinokineospora fastidiosa]|uniref:Multidrug ABC transporter ATP-binding protein n=1 Tax=Actinokineospora fastidiosa TaxID=1816 RepID=A0A918G167_9PSEU|nr:ABC transporter ATP-binding protein [Actinokineospora fastidiosa]GGS13685.1 multidrug ABC transporter ATP-binding protein [Actinokineospora fastidiosa]
MVAAARTRGLRKVYRGTVAVDHVDLEVPTGSVMGMLGPNGSGKTTTIRMLLGLVEPTAGEVELLGHRLPDGLPRALPEVGALVEGPGFHPFLSGRENLLRMGAAEPALATQAIPAAVSEALERVGLAGAADRRFKAYSLGMKQRLGLAAALLAPRRFVILDEPTNGLDPAGTRDVRAVIADLHAAGTTVLVSSHLLAEVEATCTHVAVLHQGTVVAQGDLTTLLDADSAGLLVSTPDVTRAVDALRDNRIPARAVPNGILADLTTTTAPAVVETLVRAGVPVHEVRRQRTGLEDLFARLTEPSPTDSLDAELAMIGDAR